jgi:hypothetical protein
MGGLAANIGLVVVLGLGLLVVQLIHRYHNLIWVIVAATFVQVVLTAIAYVWTRPRVRDGVTAAAFGAAVEAAVALMPTPFGRSWRRLMLLQLAYSLERAFPFAMAVVSAVLLLALVGYAGGIR